MSEDLDLKKVLRTLDEFGPTFDKANDAPGITKSVGDDVGETQTQPALRGVLSSTDRMYLQRSLMKLSQPELTELLYLQMAKKNTGIEVQKAWGGHAGLLDDPYVSKALDTSGGAALQRQDLEPILYAIFVKKFPAYDRFRKEPSNGVVHTWNQITDYGDAEFMTELGTVTDDTATYVRQTTNIAQLATRRGVTFKEQLAVPAGGMSWNPQMIEIEQGLTAMAHKLQKTIFQGQASNSGGLAANELGLYDPNGFTGLRSILNTSDAVNASPYLTSNPDNFVTKFNAAVTNISNNVGTVPNVAYMRMAEAAQVANQQTDIQRTVDRTEFTPGVMVPAIATSAGLIPIVGVPGDSIGTYTAAGTFDGKTVADVYVLDDSTITLPFLGAPGPSVLEIPPGVAGQLTRLFIVWCLMGLAVKVIPASTKIRINQATS